MPDRDLPRITNIWSRIVGDAEGRYATEVVIESDAPLPHKIENSVPGTLYINAAARAVMPEGSIPVFDGLLKQISLEQVGTTTTRVTLEWEHYGRYSVVTGDTLPARLILRLDRAPLAAILEGKKIMLDPGHGGADHGHRGPVNLWEKDVVLITAERLAELLAGARAEVLRTRTGDEEVDNPARIRMAKKHRVDLFVSLHTGFATKAWEDGNRVLYNPAEPASPVLAGLVRDALREQVNLRCKSVRPDPVYLSRLGDIPGITVEIVTISNWVEEGLLRMPRFHAKTALGIFNGIVRWLVREK